jgi:hypothetical protein
MTGARILKRFSNIDRLPSVERIWLPAVARGALQRGANDWLSS